MFKTINGGKFPTKGSKFSACVDLYANEDVLIQAGETKTVSLGVCLDYTKFPIYLKNNMNRHYLQLEPRSSLRVKGLQSGTGIIDIDYKDEIKIILCNTNTTNFTIKKGDKVAQIMLCEHKSYLFNTDTDEVRNGGFGSTGE